jgi:16S rRNA (cytosine967-C5)-methyltransferase
MYSNKDFLKFKMPITISCLLLLDVKPGMRVVILVQVQVGKTLHMAALMENKGLLTMDLYESKLKQKDKSQRDGASSKPHYRLYKSDQKLHQKADRV